MTIARVQYTEQQILRAADLTNEQEYRLAAHRRHLIGQHDWGIVQGLRLRVVPGGFVVLPGYAVDGFGHELAVPRPIFTPWATGDQNLFDMIGSEPFDPQARQFVDVWLRYARLSADPPPRGLGTCRPEPPLRWRDSAQVCLIEVRRDDRYDGPPPAEAGYSRLLPSKPRAPAPYQTLPDDPQTEWPVFLGRLVRQPQNKNHPYVVKHAERPYAGLVGASVVSASRVAVAEDPENLPDEPHPPVPSAQITARQAGERRRVAVTLADSKGALTDVLTLDTLSGAAIRGTVRLVDLAGEDNPRDAAVDLLIAAFGTELTEADIRDPAGLACALAKLGTLLDEPAGWNMSGVALDRAQDTLLRSAQAAPRRIFDLPSIEPSGLTKLLNDWLTLPGAPDLRRFANLPLRAITRTLLDPENKRPQPALARRALLEDLFPEQIVRRATLPTAYGVEFSPPPTPVKAAAPWRVYSVDVVRDGKMVRQLRIEIGTTGDKNHPERNRFMIGRWSAAQNDFEPCLSVDEACALEVLGDMMVLGDVIQNSLSSEPGNLALTIDIRNLDQAISGTNWPYNVYLKNEGTAPINSISVLENVSIGTDSETRTVTTIPSLPVGAEQTITVTHLKNLSATTGSINLIITALGFGPTFNTISVSKSKSVLIKSS